MSGPVLVGCRLVSEGPIPYGSRAHANRQYALSRMSRLWSADCCMPQRVRTFLEGLARQPGDATSIVATTEGGHAHVVDAHRAARARHKRAPKCRSARFAERCVIAQTGCSMWVTR